MIDEALIGNGVDGEAGSSVERKDIPYSGEQAATWSAMQGGVGSLGVVWRGLVSTLDEYSGSSGSGTGTIVSCPSRDTVQTE